MTKTTEPTTGAEPDAGQALTPVALRQAEIEAWQTVRRQAWSQYLIATRQLLTLGVKLKMCQCISTFDKSKKSRYTKNTTS